MNKKSKPITSEFTQPHLHPIMNLILQVKTETPQIKSFRISAPHIVKNCSPGQFLMVWIPGVDEIPMSISGVDRTKGIVEFTVACVGDATAHLHKMKKGDQLGLRGPLGQGFIIPPVSSKNPLLVVGGGCGSAPLIFAAEEAVLKGWDVHIVLGATTSEDLLYQNRFQKIAKKMQITTDDGSAGLKGTAVDGTALLVKKMRSKTDQHYINCFACGPEPMLQRLHSLLCQAKIPLQVSLERYMKCGVGLCGHCIIDIQGTRVCHEGPVFNAEDLQQTDFGLFVRDASGKRYSS